MKKKLLSVLVAISIVLGISCPAVLAVSPYDPLIASALYSFVLSAGIKLWRDGIEGSDQAFNDLVSDMKAVWDYYSIESATSVPTWDSLGSGISTDNGKMIIDYDEAQTFQGFVDWLTEYKSMKPSSTYNILEGDGNESSAFLFTLPSGETAGLTGYQNGYWAMPVSAGSGSITVTRNNSADSSSYSGGSYAFQLEGTNRYKQVFLIDDAPFTVSYSDGRTANSSLVTLNNVSRPNSGSSNFQYSRWAVSYDSRNYSCSVPGNAFTAGNEGDISSEIGYVILAGDRVGSQESLFASVGWTVGNNVFDLLQDQSLVIDVGAGAGADEEDIVAVVVDGFSVPATADVVPSAVAYPLPVAGVEELYPQPGTVVDVDNLGLPDLGRALTTRFPFCIPWDVVYLYQSLNASPERPVIDIDIIPQSFKQRVGIVADTSFTFDLGDQKYELVLKIVRWSTLVGFVLGLAFATKRLIWTTGG